MAEVTTLKLKTPISSTPLPDSNQPSIGLHVTEPLPPKEARTTAVPNSEQDAALDSATDSFDSNSWYKIKNAAKPGRALDVINDGNQERDGRLQMAADGDFSGQYWQLRPSRTSPGSYNLCTMWLGRNKALDVYGDDKTTPHLTTAGNYSGQQWQIRRHGRGTWSLTNLYSAPLVLAADGSGDGLHLRDALRSPLSHWILERVRPITEGGFGLFVNGSL